MAPIRVIKLETLTDEELEVYYKLDAQSFGESLSQQIALKLKKPMHEGRGLFHGHRDYCGLGLCFHKGVFTIGEIHDGYTPPHPVILSFEKEKDFVSWLSKESEQNMALYGEKFNNQTITRIRLEWFLEDNYSSVWNDYRAYLRERFS